MLFVSFSRIDCPCRTWLGARQKHCIAVLYCIAVSKNYTSDPKEPRSLHIPYGLHVHHSAALSYEITHRHVCLTWYMTNLAKPAQPFHILADRSDPKSILPSTADTDKFRNIPQFYPAVSSMQIYHWILVSEFDIANNYVVVCVLQIITPTNCLIPEVTHC